MSIVRRTMRSVGKLSACLAVIAAATNTSFGSPFIVEDLIRDPNIPGYSRSNHQQGLVIRDSQFLNGQSRAAQAGQIQIRNNSVVRLQDVKITGSLDYAAYPGFPHDPDIDPTTDLPRKFKYGIQAGTSDEFAEANKNGRVELLRVDISKIGSPSGDYPNYNRDGITYEEANGHLLIRDSTIKDASDGIIDSRIAFAARGSTFENAYRILRVREDSYIWDCHLKGPDPAITNTDWDFIWFPNNEVKLFVYGDSTFTEITAGGNYSPYNNPPESNVCRKH